jgi:TonB-dependent receptor
MVAEWYFARGGLLSAGVFAKFIKDPIFTSTFTVEDGSFGGSQYERIEFTQPLNGDSADLVGLELAYQQQFTFLRGFLSGFGVNLSLTLIDSKLRIPDNAGGSRTTGFPEQSKLLYGAQLFYQNGPVEASIAYHHTGLALILNGENELEDQFNDDLRRLDAKASFALTSNIGVFVEAQNLTDEPTRQFQGGRRDWVIQNERYGRTFWAGASLRF